MSEIEVGEYVRTINGEIGKVYKIFETKVMTYEDRIYFIATEIVKHSKELIDLIEVGDYVLIEDLPYEQVWQIIAKDNKYKINNFKDLKAENIKVIATKEQFSSIEYKV